MILRNDDSNEIYIIEIMIVNPQLLLNFYLNLIEFLIEFSSDLFHYKSFELIALSCQIILN